MAILAAWREVANIQSLYKVRALLFSHHHHQQVGVRSPIQMFSCRVQCMHGRTRRTFELCANELYLYTRNSQIHRKTRQEGDHARHSFSLYARMENVQNKIVYYTTCTSMANHECWAALLVGATGLREECLPYGMNNGMPPALPTECESSQSLRRIWSPRTIEVSYAPVTSGVSPWAGRIQAPNESIPSIATYSHQKRDGWVIPKPTFLRLAIASRCHLVV